MKKSNTSFYVNISEEIKDTRNTVSKRALQTTTPRETLNLSSLTEKSQGHIWADSLVWLGYHPYEVMVAGSNPARPTQRYCRAIN